MSRGQGIKEIEEFPKRLKIFFFIILFLLIFGTLFFKLITDESLKDSMMRTIETLAFMFHEDSGVYERLLEVFLAIIGVFLVWWVLWSVADMLLDGNLEKSLKTRIYSLKIKEMKNHIIIAGGGRVGEEIARVISIKNKKFIIIDSDETMVNSLRKKGYIVVSGDASNESVLKEAGIQYAKKIMITLPKAETNILVTLTSKELNPEIEIYSRCEKPSLVSKLKKAGAKVVIVPEIIAADKLAEDLGL